MEKNPYLVGEHQTPGDLQSLGPKFDQQLRVMQIIAVALMMGVLTFFGIVLVITKGDVFGQNGPTLLTMVAAVFAGIMVVSHMALPQIVARAQLKIVNGQTTSEQAVETRGAGLVVVYQVQLIIALALLEGAAFFNLVVLMTGRHVVSTVLAACLILLMLLKFPTRTKVSWWVQDRMRELP